MSAPATPNNNSTIGRAYNIIASVAGMAKNTVIFNELDKMLSSNERERLFIAEDNAGTRESDIGVNNEGTRLKIGTAIVVYAPYNSFATLLV